METLIWSNRDLKAPLIMSKGLGVILGHQVFIEYNLCLCVQYVSLYTVTAFGPVCMCLFMQHHRKLVHFTGFLKIVLSPGVIVCLCVTDTSKNRAKTGLAAPAV